MRPLLLALSALLGVVASAAPVQAQRPPARLAVSVGPDWIGTADVGGTDATLTSAGGGRFTLFKTTSTLSGGVGVSGALGVRVVNNVWTELTGRYHSARLATRVTSDVEAADETSSEALQQLQVDAGLLWLPERLRVAPRMQLFLTGGAGYLRQLHSTNTLAETGRGYYVGSGLIVSLPERRGGTFTAAGIRLDVRAAMTTKGVAFDNRVHAAPAVWASLFLRF